MMVTLSPKSSFGSRALTSSIVKPQAGHTGSLFTGSSIFAILPAYKQGPRVAQRAAVDVVPNDGLSFWHYAPWVQHPARDV